jgi:hypothetical protein
VDERQELELVVRRPEVNGFQLVYGPIFFAVADMTCFRCGYSPCTPHHVKTVKNGGQDYANLVDVCFRCHLLIEQQMGRKTFEATFKVNLAERAKKLVDKYPRWLKRDIETHGIA